MARTNLPVDQDYTEARMPEIAEIEYTDEQVLAKLADTEGWKKITDYARQRIEFYQKFYPGQEGLGANSTAEEIAIGWKTAVNIIQEFENLLGQVESAKNAIKARQQ